MSRSLNYWEKIRFVRFPHHLLSSPPPLTDWLLISQKLVWLACELSFAFGRLPNAVGSASALHPVV